jgi:hypothetical protein
MDWSTVILLAAVTWLDGVRRVPIGAVAFRRVLGDEWTVVEAAEPGQTWRLVSWWSPFMLALVVPPGGIPDVQAPRDRTDDALASRLARAGRVLLGLRALGASVLVGIVIGLPAAIARFGSSGFAAAIAGVLLLALATAVAASCVLRGFGYRWRRAARLAAPLLWPFGAPRAAEVVLEQAIAGAPPLMVARRLLGAAGFATWIRPQAYDALRGEGSAREFTAALSALVGRPGLATIVQTPPANCEAGEYYCVRCARVYQAGTAICAECRNVPLVRAPNAAAQLGNASTSVAQTNLEHRPVTAREAIAD